MIRLLFPLGMLCCALTASGQMRTSKPNGGTGHASSAPTSKPVPNDTAQFTDIIVGGGSYVDARFYGVVADGSTDNSTALQTAINTMCANATQPRTLILQPGTTVIGTGVTIPATCTQFRLSGPGSGQRTGSPKSASGTSRLSYTGDGAAITLGSEATPAKSNISSASRTSNIVTLVSAYNSTLASMTTSDQIMIRGLTPTDLNVEDIRIASITTDGSTEVTITYSSNGPDETASSVAGAYVDYAWNDNSYYANAASGFALENINLSCDSTHTTQLLNYQSYTDPSPDTGSNHAKYATTAYGIQAWRAPNILIKNSGFTACYAGFFGTNSDEDTFDHARFIFNHIGAWHSSQDSQTLFDFPYSAGNDEAIVLDGTLNVTIRHWTSDTDGSATTSALTLQGAQLGRNTVGTQCYDCWFENNHGSTISVYKSYVSIGEIGTTPVMGVDFYNPMFSAPSVPTANAPQTVSFATIGYGDALHVHYPVNINHVGSNIQPNPLFQFTGSYSPQDVFVVTGQQTLTALSSNSGTGTPNIVWNQTNANYQWLGGGHVYMLPIGTANASVTGYNGSIFGQCGSFYAGGATHTPCWTQVLAAGPSYANITVQPTTDGSPSVQWTWGQPVASTSQANVNSIPMYWQYRVQHGGSDTLANMKLQIVPQSSGNDPAVEFKFSHSGNDAGPIDVNFPSVKSVLQGSETVPYSATPTFSTTTRSSIIALTGNITNFTFAAGADGQEKTLIFCQDSTGNHTVTGPPQVRGFFTVGAMASMCSAQHFTYSTGQSAWLADSPGVTNF